MGESVKKYGVLNKPRFSIKLPNGEVQRYGSCDPKEDDRRKIIAYNNAYCLSHDDKDNPETNIAIIPLPEGTMATNGWYDHEHDGWVDLETFYNQE